MKYIFFIIFIYFSGLCFSKGIIIADEEEQTKLFNISDSNGISSFADSIASHYSKVIIHLGRSFVFRKGNIYSQEKSRKNLAVFCKKLNQMNIPVFLWFFDSYGGEKFKKIYNEYKEMIDENIDELQKNNIYFDGIVVDIEWINLNNFDNNKQFVDVLKYLHEKINNKKVFFFTSLIDSPIENKERGYDLDEIKKIPAYPITMLYISDGGFIDKKGSIVPNLNEDRIKSLVKFYRRNKWEIAYSLESGFIKKIKGKLDFLGEIEQDIIDQNLIQKKKRRTRYYSITDYLANNDFSFSKNSEQKIKINKNETLQYLQITLKIPDENCYLWEYFSMKPKEK